jgi:replicative DNA helicase
MTVDIQKIALRRLLSTQSTDFYNKLVSKFFNDTNLIIFRKIVKFYEKNMRIPTMQEFYESQKIENIKDYLSSQIYAEIPEEQYLSSQFIADQLQDYFIREETINWLDKFMDQLEHLERLEIIDSIQNHILELHKFLPEGEELFDVATIDSFLGEEQFVMYSSGLSTEYDVVNGGFGLEELIMLGGRRGSGKSIITLNTAKHQFEKNNNSVLFMSIEMRYVEVYYRLMSMLSGVSFMRFIKNDLNTADKLLLAKTKLETFYEATEEASQLYSDLVKTGNLKEFDYGLKTGKAKFKEKRFHIVDDVNLSLAKIDHYLNLMTKKYDVKMCVIDYLNIVKVEDRMDWKSQIAIADQLKTLSRKYKVMMVSPYQIDATGEARFAKGVLDSADRSFRFTPADLNEDPSVLPFEITKIRNGKSMKFNVHMDWECLKIVPESSKVIEGKILNKYGNDQKEFAGDLG